MVVGRGAGLPTDITRSVDSKRKSLIVKSFLQSTNDQIAEDSIGGDGKNRNFNRQDPKDRLVSKD